MLSCLAFVNYVGAGEFIHLCSSFESSTARVNKLLCVYALHSVQ